MNDKGKRLSAGLFVFFTVFLISSAIMISDACAVTIRERDLSLAIGLSAAVTVELDNSAGITASSRTATLSIIPAGCGEFVFQETGIDSMAVSLLPKETKRVKALFTAQSTGVCTLTANDGTGTDSAKAIVTEHPAFPESDTGFAVIIILISIGLYAAFCRAG